MFVASASPSPRSLSAVALASASSTVRSRLGIGPDARRRLRALGACLRGDPLAFRLHPRQDRLGVLLRQIGAPDPHVVDGDAEILHLGVHLVADRGHDPLPIGRQHVEQLVVAEHPAQAAETTELSRPRMSSGIGPIAW